MRYCEILSEKVLHIEVSGNELTVHEMPSFSALVGFTQNKGIVRGMITTDNRSYFFAGFESYHYDVAEKLGLLSDNGYSLVVSMDRDLLLSENDWTGDVNSIALFECRGMSILVGRRMGLLGFEALPEVQRLFPNIAKVPFKP